MFTRTWKLELTTPPTWGNTHTRQLDTIALQSMSSRNMQRAASTGQSLSENRRCAPPAEEIDQGSGMNDTMVNVGHAWQFGDTAPLIKMMYVQKNFGTPCHKHHRLEVVEARH